MSEHRGTFGDYLRREMTARGWNNARLAEAADMPVSNVGRYLSGKQKVTVDTARGIAKALKRPVLEVLVAAAILSAEEAQVEVIAADPLRALGHREILAELDRRLTRPAGDDVLAELSVMAHDPDLSEDVNVPGSGPRRLQKDS